MKKTWKILNDVIYESYDKENRPEEILNYYGLKLNKETSNLLGYHLTVCDEYDQNNQIVFCGKKTLQFSVKITINSKYIPFFEVSYNKIIGYPCIFKNMLKNDDGVVCNDAKELKNVLDATIGSENTIVTISKILYSYYSKEIINKINK